VTGPGLPGLARARLSGTGPGARSGYGACMGKIFLVVIAALVVVMLLSVIVAALHMLFWVALIAVVGIAALRLGRGTRRSSRN
jgi:Flp pilus assembly protein TadB